MVKLSLALLAYALVGSALPTDTIQGWSSHRGGYTQAPGETAQEAQQRAAFVQSVFQTAWNGYYKYAFPNDELLPVTNGFTNPRNGWGASAIDAFSTAIIMRNNAVVNEILAHIPTINWSISYQNTQVSLFETTIRYLGGLLSGYDLLNGPQRAFCSDHNRQVILQQAQNLANNLSYAFATDTGIPYNNLYFNNRSNDGSTTNGLATIGSLVLEWTHLSDLTGDAVYGQLARKGESYLLDPQPASAQPFPGLVGSNVNIQTGLFTDAVVSWNGGDDSFYEYLIKMYVYDQSRFQSYADRWVLAADSSIEFLASHPTTRPDLTFLAAYNKTLQFNSGHLACFDGGNFILGGLVLNQQKYIDFGLQLVDSCEDLYNQTVTGIGPESFSWNPSPANPLNATQAAFYERAGYIIQNANYLLRPEVLESFYYAYRATGDRKYQDYSWNGFNAIVKNTQVGSGYSEIVNVNTAGGGGDMGSMDSFFFAEVLKYAYIIHADFDAEWQVNEGGVNAWVFNTEGHPLKVAGKPI